MRGIGIGALAAACALLLGAILAGPWAFSRIELAPLRYDVIGVDVSRHQGLIDWRTLAGSGIGFAYIKATEGATFRDANFATNWSEAALAGVPRGAYHFFIQCRPGADQAQNFIATVPRDPQALPHVIDAEHMGPCRTGPVVADVVQEIEIFLALIEAHYGRRPLIYTTFEFHNVYLKGRLAGERFWLRSLVIPPRFGGRSWTIWQYHNRGRRPGITGEVDLNAFNGSRPDFATFAQPAP
jgi:lysozyme